MPDIGTPSSFHDLFFFLYICSVGEGCWLEGTVYVNFSIPLGGQQWGRDCYAFYSLDAVSNGRVGLNSNSNNHDGGDDNSNTNDANRNENTSSNDGVRSDSVSPSSGVSSSYQVNSGINRWPEGVHITQLSGQVPGPSCSFVMKDTILSPSTSGTTSKSNVSVRAHNDEDGDHLVTSHSSSSSSSYSNKSRQSNQDGNVKNIDSSTNNSKNSSSRGSSSSGGSGSVLDVCRWIPTYTGEAFGLRHSVRTCDE